MIFIGKVLSNATANNASLSNGAAIVLDGEADVDHLAESRVDAPRVGEADPLRAATDLELEQAALQVRSDQHPVVVLGLAVSLYNDNRIL